MWSGCPSKIIVGSARWIDPHAQDFTPSRELSCPGDSPLVREVYVDFGVEGFPADEQPRVWLFDERGPVLKARVAHLVRGVDAANEPTVRILAIVDVGGWELEKDVKVELTLRVIGERESSAGELAAALALVG